MQAQWAGKLLQEYQRRAAASGFPGPHADMVHQSKDSPAKTAEGVKRHEKRFVWLETVLVVTKYRCSDVNT